LTPKRTTNHLKLSWKGLKMINPNPEQACLDPSMTHSNPMMIAAVMKTAATRTAAGAEARVTETEKRGAAATAAEAASGSAVGTAAGAAGPAGEVVSA